MTAAESGPGNNLPGPLAGLRVLELTGETAQFCGKLMADLGADVIKIEPPGGQETRNLGPFLDDHAHPERSLSFWHYNTSKRGVTIDITKSGGKEIFRAPLRRKLHGGSLYDGQQVVVTVAVLGCANSRTMRGRKLVSVDCGQSIEENRSPVCHSRRPTKSKPVP